MPRLRFCPQCLALFGAVSHCLADHLRTKCGAEHARVEIRFHSIPPIPSEAAAEVIIDGATTAGMTGGPVVDCDGRLISVLVRASDGQAATSYVRAVSMR